MQILIIKHVMREGPGILQTLLEEYKIPFLIVDLEKGDKIPEVNKFTAVIVLGGPQSANDETTTMKTELKKVRELLDLEIPYFGICLGMQILAKAAGGTVVKSSQKEIGWKDSDRETFTVHLTAEGRNDELFAGMPPVQPIFQLHGETVLLCSSVHLLGTGKTCSHQVIKYGKNAYGIQGHYELTRRMLEYWLNADEDLQTLPAKNILTDYYTLRGTYKNNARILFTNFFKIAKLI